MYFIKYEDVTFTIQALQSNFVVFQVKFKMISYTDE